MEKNSVQAEIASYIGKLLRDNFGKGPSSVYVSLKKPFITIHLRDFLAPMERVLLSQGETMKVEETRDLLMQELIPGIKVTLKVIASLEVKELYYDWSLHNRSGILVGVLENEEDEDNALENYTEKESVHKDIMRISRQAEKLPEFVDSCFLNERTLLVIRTGILVRIEKELIKTGFEEHLKLTKRQLEKGLLHAGDFENILQKSVVDIFVDWDFKLDKSYIIFILQPNNN
ncbi:Na-translocating system protein MpsC family protein [Oceanobacillus profundus]|uniref:Na-translocating system protein MpsC family protein n=1 Tax=Oceanobacillus TaxID=182709 RepID=UPI0026E1DC6A|nr:Na-translocating system protein MpsC family protein [Oceanobacillus profundus]MDO6451461.1 Na-translocating system protein MpsC family protein [Oceanobacillus profundus]